MDITDEEVKAYLDRFFAEIIDSIKKAVPDILIVGDGQK